MTSRPSSEHPAPSSPDSGAKSREKPFLKSVRQLRAASLGWNFVAAPLVGGAMGYGVDWLISSYPWAMIAGLILGFVSAFIEVLRSAR